MYKRPSPKPCKQLAFGCIKSLLPMSDWDEKRDEGADGESCDDRHGDAHQPLSCSTSRTFQQSLPVPTQAALKLASHSPSASAAERQPGSGSGRLTRTFRFSVILASLLMMLAVVLCLFVVLPRLAKTHAHGARALGAQSESKLLTATACEPTPLPHPDTTSPNSHPRRRKQERSSPCGAALIATACKATLLPHVCRTSLLSDPAAESAPSLLPIIDIALEISRSHILSCASLSDALLRSPLAAGNINLTDAARDCSYLLGRAESLHGRTQATSFAAQKPWQIADSQAWMSAALTYENDCRSALSYVNVSASVDYLMGQVSYAINLTSNALGMIGALREYGGDGEGWAPPTRLSLYRAVPPPPGSPSGHGSFEDLRRWWRGASAPAATVAKDGSGDYSTVQAAVDAVPEGEGEGGGGSDWYTIHVKEGVYEEIVRVAWGKMKIVMVGDGMGKTVITGSLNAQMPGVITYDTPTVAVDSDGFVAIGMTFENTAGAAKHQAVALRVDSDFSAFYNCSFLGYQDTLYAHALRQFYHGCRMEGTVDFVFGNAAAVFERCEVVFRRGLPGAGASMATAQGRTDPGQATGLVFRRCTLDGTASFRAAGNGEHRRRAYLGRPWKLYSRTVFLECWLPGFLRPEGWLPWNGDFALSTLFYGEFNDTGPGARPASDRVTWSQQLSYDVASLFAVVPFIQGDRWLPPNTMDFLGGP